MSPMRELPPELLQRFTQVDYADHVALVAEVFADGRETVIAEARYVRGPRSVGGGVRRVGGRALAGQGAGAPDAGQARLPRRRAPASGASSARRSPATPACCRWRARPALSSAASPDVAGLMLLEKPLRAPLPAASRALAACTQLHRDSRSAYRDPGPSGASQLLVPDIRCAIRDAPSPRAPGLQRARHPDHEGREQPKRRP